MIGILTARNWIVYHHFIPVSLGAGQTLLEGIADYDSGKRFGIPETDMAIMKLEADELNRPDYYASLFSPDGVKRERMRLARGFGIIIRNPVWFLSVMVRRAGSMLRLERTRTISTTPSVMHDISQAKHHPVLRLSPQEFFNGLNEKSPGAEISFAPDSQTLRIATDNSKYGAQLRSAIAVKPKYDYLLRVPVKMEEGRLKIDLSEPSSSQMIGSATLEKLETRDPSERPTINVEIPFASGSQDSISIELRNAAAQSGKSVVLLGPLEIYELGPASFLWTRYPRVVVASIQRLFMTAIMLPLSILGIGLLVHRRAWRVLILFLVVPVYYMCVQSWLHTEYRYVLAIHYFLFLFVAVALEWGLSTSTQFVLRRKIGTNVK